MFTWSLRSRHFTMKYALISIVKSRSSIFKISKLSSPICTLEKYLENGKKEWQHLWRWVPMWVEGWVELAVIGWDAEHRLDWTKPFLREKYYHYVLIAWPSLNSLNNSCHIQLFNYFNSIIVIVGMQNVASIEQNLLTKAELLRPLIANSKRAMYK